VASVQFSSVAQLCPTLCDPMNRSTPGLPVHHQLPEFTHSHVHRVGDAIQPSHPLSSKTLDHTSLVVIVGHSLTTWGISLALTVYTIIGHLSPQGLLCVGGVAEKYTQSSQLPPGLALSLAAEQGLL